MMVMNLALPSERLRALDRLIAKKKHTCLLRASSPIDQTRRSGIFGLLGGARGSFLVAAAMVIWVLLAVGRWPLVAWCFCWHKSYIIVGMV
jgi:hypothetical protein